jgi:hypothetical protein
MASTHKTGDGITRYARIGASMLLVATVTMLGCGPSAARLGKTRSTRQFAANGRVTEAYLNDENNEWWDVPPLSNGSYGYAVGSSAASREDAVDVARRELVMKQGVFLSSYDEMIERGSTKEYAVEILVRRFAVYAADLGNTDVRKYRDEDDASYALVELDVAQLRKRTEANRREVRKALDAGHSARRVGNIRVSIRSYLHALVLAYERLEGSDADRPEGSDERLSVTIERGIQSLVGDIGLELRCDSALGILGRPWDDPVVAVARIDRLPVRGLDVEFQLRAGRADIAVGAGLSSSSEALRARTDASGRAECAIRDLGFLGDGGELVATVVLDPLLDEVTARVDDRVRPRIQRLLTGRSSSSALFRFESIFGPLDHQGLQASFPNAPTDPIFGYGDKQTLVVHVPRACQLSVFHMDEDGDLNHVTSLPIDAEVSRGGYAVQEVGGGAFQVTFDNLSLTRESRSEGDVASEAVVLVATILPLDRTPGKTVNPSQLRRELDLLDPEWVYGQVTYGVR